MKKLTFLLAAMMATGLISACENERELEREEPGRVEDRGVFEGEVLEEEAEVDE